jgi:hypothetical protein
MDIRKELIVLDVAAAVAFGLMGLGGLCRVMEGAWWQLSVVAGCAIMEWLYVRDARNLARDRKEEREQDY